MLYNSRRDEMKIYYLIWESKKKKKEAVNWERVYGVFGRVIKVWGRQPDGAGGSPEDKFDEVWLLLPPQHKLTPHALKKQEE